MNASYLIKRLFSYSALFILLAIFVLLILYTLTTISKVSFLFAEYIRVSVFEEVVDTGVNIPELVLKAISIFISLYLLFILNSIISAVAAYKSYEMAAYKHSYKKPNIEDVFFKAIRWNFYRFRYILSPLLKVGIIIGITFFVSTLLFNAILFLAGVNIEILTFLISFILISLFIGIIFAIGISFWRVFITLFGIECAVSEPELDNHVITKRAKRLSLVKKSNITLYVLYTIFLLTLLVQFVGIIFTPKILNEENSVVLAVIIVIDILFYIGLGYFKSSLYVDSVLYQYNRITFTNKNYLKQIILDL